MTASYATIDTSLVTPEQIGRCSKIFGPDNKAFYAVLSESDDLTEYHVKFERTPKPHFTCTCPSGREGFINVHNKNGVCKHVVWALAAAKEERQALKAMEQAEEPCEEEKRPSWYNPANKTSYHDGTRKELMLVGYLEADDATYERVMNAKPKPHQQAKGDLYSKPFRLLR